jgi:hypothetical protein
MPWPLRFTARQSLRPHFLKDFLVSGAGAALALIEVNGKEYSLEPA